MINQSELLKQNNKTLLVVLAGLIIIILFIIRGYKNLSRNSIEGFTNVLDGKYKISFIRDNVYLGVKDQREGDLTVVGSDNQDIWHVKHIPDTKYKYHIRNLVNGRLLGARPCNLKYYENDVDLIFYENDDLSGLQQWEIIPLKNHTNYSVRIVGRNDTPDCQKVLTYRPDINIPFLRRGSLERRHYDWHFTPV